MNAVEAMLLYDNDKMKDEIIELKAALDVLTSLIAHTPGQTHNESLDRAVDWAISLIGRESGT